MSSSVESATGSLVLRDRILSFEDFVLCRVIPARAPSGPLLLGSGRPRGLLVPTNSISRGIKYRKSMWRRQSALAAPLQA